MFPVSEQVSAAKEKCQRADGKGRYTYPSGKEISANGTALDGFTGHSPNKVGRDVILVDEARVERRT
jgi:hypothetical protein